MNDNRRQILDMLAAGKITAEEAERLMTALEREPGAVVGARLKYLRVLVDAEDECDGRTKVNLRVPMQLLRAGVRLTGIIPAHAREQVNDALHKEGISFDINKLTPDNLEDLLDHLRDLEVNVDNEHAKVRVFCE